MEPLEEQLAEKVEYSRPNPLLKYLGYALIIAMALALVFWPLALLFSN